MRPLSHILERWNLSNRHSISVQQLKKAVINTTRSPEKFHYVLSLTLPNADRFPKLFHRQT